MTQQETLNILAYLDRANLSIAKEGQAAVWMDVISQKMPQMRYVDAQEACRNLATGRTAAQRNTFITPGDLIAEVRRIRNQRMRPIGTNIPRPPGLPAGDDLRWDAAFTEAICDGHTVEQATAAANKATGFTPRPEIEPGPRRPLSELVAQFTKNTELPKETQ